LGWGQGIGVLCFAISAALATEFNRAFISAFQCLIMYKSSIKKNQRLNSGSASSYEDKSIEKPILLFKRGSLMLVWSRFKFTRV